MKNIFKLLILTFAVSSPALVSAAQWQSFGKSEGSEFFFDRDSISGPATERLLVVKRNYLEGKLAPTSIELKYKINCIAEESIITSGTVYQEPDLQGEIRPTAFPGLNISKKQVPNTMGSLYIKTACAGQSAAKPINESTQTGRSLAANWRLIFKTNNAEIYIDQSSIPSAGTEKTILVKSNEVQGERSPSSLELKYQVNCAANEVAVIGAKQYKSLDLQGDAMTLDTSNPPKFIEAKPGSAAGAYVKAACEQTKQDAGTPSKQSQNTQQQVLNNSSFICHKEEFLSRLDGLIEVYPPGSAPTWRTGAVGIQAEDIGVIFKGSERVETTEYSKKLTKTFMAYDKVGLVNLTLPLGKSFPNYLKFSFTKAHETYSIYVPANFPSLAQFPFITRLDSKQTLEYNDYRIGQCKPGSLAVPIPPKPLTKEQAAAAEQNAKVRRAQDMQIFGLVDDYNTRLIDQSSASRRVSSCIGVMKGAQYAANSISQQNLSMVLAQQESAFYSFGSSRFPPVDTLERLLLDGAMSDGQSGAEVLTKNNQQALVFKIANNCKAALGNALKN